jgi:hypothetical protein
MGVEFSSRIAVSILYPLILAKTRLQARKKSPGSAKKIPPSIYSVLVEAYARPVPSKSGQKLPAGMKGIYQGLEMQIIKGFLSQGVTFLVKGRYGLDT